ncbi:sugar ABC transporter substrate-binding protein [Paenibacillus cremeus]|uniref:Sugar ABC transporter substrate-binding protein n=2 Tax=Paenibacillus cremeus TaxID=2163881 RepID=A0A559KBP6_9BACL|nr:sugar ABC transporter substrate-binding protein [Paenibacillus cremeus]
MALAVDAGCSSQDGYEKAPEAPPASGIDSDKKITLQMMESLTNPKRTALLSEMIAKFESRNPGIKVVLISPPFDQADSTIRAMLSAKQDLDVLEVRDNNIASLSYSGYLEPLNAFAAHWPDYATVGPVAESIGSAGGQLYFIANGLYQRQLFYRKDWLEAKGLQPPTTWQELYETGKKLTDAAQNRYGFSFRGGPGSIAVIDSMVLAFNGEKVNLEDGQFLKDGTTIYSSPEAQRAAELYLKLYQDASPPDSVYWGFQEQVQAFISGVTGMLLQDPDVIQTIQDKMKPDTWATAPMPLGPTGKSLITAGGAGWGIAAASKNKAAAWKLITFLSSPEQNISFSKNYGLIPIHTSAAYDPYFQSGPYKTLLEMTQKTDTFLHFKPPFQYQGLAQWAKESMDTGQAMLLGRATVQETLSKWDVFWEEQKSPLK